MESDELESEELESDELESDELESEELESEELESEEELASDDAGVGSGSGSGSAGGFPTPPPTGESAPDLNPRDGRIFWVICRVTSFPRTDMVVTAATPVNPTTKQYSSKLAPRWREWKPREVAGAALRVMSCSTLVRVTCLLSVALTFGPIITLVLSNAYIRARASRERRI